MMRIKRLLVFFRLVDLHDGLLSLTSLGVIICLAKIALQPCTSPSDLGALLLTLLAYQARKVVQARKEALPVGAVVDPALVSTLQQQVSAWEGKLAALVGSVALGGGRR